VASVGLHRVSKEFPNGARALSELSLTVHDKELLVVVGPSGCGKSTALRIVAGLDESTSGEVTIGDRVVDGVRASDRDIAMVFQSFALYPHMTARRNIGFPLLMRKMSDSRIDRRVEEVAATLGIGTLLDRKPGQLSGGERQRVAMARAIARAPAVCLMDEPLSNVDAKLRTYTRAFIASMQRYFGTTMVYVTHDQVEAMTIGHRVAVMRDGVLQQCDTPAMLYAKPANTFVAGFFGSPPSNLFEAGLGVDAEGGLHIRLGGGDIDVTPVAEGRRRLIGAHAHGTVIIGVRPEHVRLTSDGDPDAVPAVVEVVEALGSETLAYLSVAGHHGLHQSQGLPSFIAPGGANHGDTLIARLAPHRVPRLGERVAVSIDTDKVMFFDQDGVAIG
jgi:multiple sugar transport system ATP-binding protein